MADQGDDDRHLLPLAYPPMPDLIEAPDPFKVEALRCAALLYEGKGAETTYVDRNARNAVRVAGIFEAYLRGGE